MSHEAGFYNRNADESTSCQLCPHGCRIVKGGWGRCSARQNIDGVLLAATYGEVSATALDPIEKKPLYHYKPGSKILSVGSSGCNLSCGFCQNYRISMEKPKTRQILPVELVNAAVKLHGEGNIGIAFTYNEPTIGIEYVLDTAKLVKAAGMDVILVTNGFINQKPMLELAGCTDAMNIDLKAFTERFYHETCKGALKPVQQTIELLTGRLHLELTTLVIEGYNDSLDEMNRLCEWVASIDPAIPLHLSAYYPAYHFDAPPTSGTTLASCRAIAEKHLRHVYVGNLAGTLNNTHCEQCGKLLVDRGASSVHVHLVNGNQCPQCSSSSSIIV